ncbi:uncharacterized protein LOC26527801 [Drosophila mojavensis]|uniref:Ionotropic glutamate receptor C-terminal domain-containing protein n=1 Tax=Drosophila mojavensis TaxID=7230 RepID=A0A0Q9XL97_DROMO|nr:uncharacterized protein LOC26527801 [Drosophila mojavensis]KRG05678.1 uncharacterized protein Dmoj_GI26160 [Drosophila mojavensis]
MWILFGIFLGLSSSTATNIYDTAPNLSESSCRIARTEAAQITYIYRCVTCVATSSVSYLELEQDLHLCIGAQLPSCIRSLEAHEVEPIRETNSMNIFLIPAGDGGQPLVRRIVDMLNPRQQRRHFHKYLFVWPEASEDQLRELFEGCWSKQLLFGLAITGPETIYDFQPFGEQGLQLTKLIFGTDVYYVDKLKNLNGFELRFSMFRNPLRALPLDPVESKGYRATDGNVARLIAEKLNATAKYVTPRDNEAYGRCLPNGSFTGVVKDLMNGETHIGLNMRFVLECISPYVEHLYPHNRVVICLVVPAARMQPEYLIFVTAFQRTVWHVLLANFLIFLVLLSVLYHLIWKIIGETRCRWYDACEMLFKTHLGQPVDRFSGASSLRMFLMGWILFSYVLTTIYFGKLESSFVQPSFEEEVDTLDQLVPLGLRVHGVITMFNAVNLSLSKEHFDLLTKSHRVHPLKDSDHFYELSISRRNKKAAFIMRIDKAKEFLAVTYNSEVGRPTYHIVKQYLRSLPGTYILPMGSPFRYKFQSMLSAFYEHGFFEYWRQMDVLQRSRTSGQSEEFFEQLDEQTGMDTEDAAADTEEWRKKRVVLTLDILQGAFYLWFIGILLSIVGFVLEQGYFHWRRTNLVYKL